MKVSLPETMKLNLAGLRNVQSRIQNIIVNLMSSSFKNFFIFFLVLRQALLSRQIVRNQEQMESVIAESYNQLSKCLSSVDDAGIRDIIEILGAAAVQKASKSEDMKLGSMNEFMASMLVKSLQEGDPVFTRVSRAVYLAIRRVMLGGSGNQGKKELAAMALQKVAAVMLRDEVVKAASVLLVTAKVSVSLIVYFVCRNPRGFSCS